MCCQTVLNGRCTMPARLLVLFSSSVLAVTVSAADFHVAVTGDDGNPGTREKPFATLERAQQAARKAGPGTTVIVGAGTYYLTAPLAFTEQDSGTAEVPVVYRAAEGTRPVLSGARILPVAGFTPYKGNILKLELGDIEIKETDFRQLFLDGRRMELARRPNADPERPFSGGWSYVGGKSEEKQKEEKPVSRLAFQEGDVGPYAHPEDGEVNIYSGHNWNNQILPIASIDYDENVIELGAKAHHCGILPNNRYYLRNLFEELDAPGEWFLDRREKVLYFWPPEPLTDRSVICSPVVTEVITVGRWAKTTCSYLQLQGFLVEYADNTGILLDGAEHCLVAGNEVRRISSRPSWNAAGIWTGPKSRENRIAGNDIYDTGSYGIAIGGGDPGTWIPANNVAENNYTHHIGAYDGHATGLRIGGCGNRLSHNLIHDTARCGIFGGGPLHVIEYNRIRHTNLKTCDTGGIYICGRSTGWTPKGMVIRHNFVSDVIGFGCSGGKWVAPYYSWGIYLDDGTSGVHVYGNIVTRAYYEGAFIHGGRENIIENNILVGNRRGQMLYSGWEPPDDVREQVGNTYAALKQLPAFLEHCPAFADLGTDAIGKMAANRFLRNIVVSTQPYMSWYQERNLVTDGMESDYNLLWNSAGPGFLMGFSRVDPRKQWDQWRDEGFDMHSVVADPLFVDADNDDYRLQPESPAFKLGFQRIPAEKIGPYESPLRASWPIVETEGIREHPHACERMPDPEIPYKDRTPHPKKTIRVPLVSTPFTVDGQLSDSGWQQAAVESMASTPGGDKIRGAACELRIAHDGKRLIVALTVPVGQTGNLKLGSEWGKDDGAEVCFARATTTTLPDPIFAIHGFADGTKESIPEPGAPKELAEAVGKATEFRAQIHEGTWTAEWAVPLAVANLAGDDGTLRIAFNAGVWRSESHEWITWIGTRGSTWEVGQAGILELSD